MEKPRQLSEKNAQKPPAKTGEANPAAGATLTSKPQAKCREAKPATGEKLTSKPTAASGEAKTAVGEKNAQKPPAKTGEAEPAVRNLLRNQQLKVKKPNQLSEDSCFDTTS